MSEVAVSGAHRWLREQAPALSLALIASLTLVRLLILAFEPYPVEGDEAQYWIYGEHVAFGYYSKPPLAAWIIRLSTDLFGDGGFGIRAASPVLHGAIAWVLFLLGQRLFGSGVGLVSAALYLTLPAVSFSSGLMSTDPPMMFGWALALYALVRALEDERARIWWLVAGSALGLALLAKYTAIALALSLLALALVSRRGRHLLGQPGPWWALGMMTLVLAPNLLWNALNDFPTLRHLEENTGSDAGTGLHPLELLAFVGSQVAVVGPVLFGLLVAAAFHLRQRSPNQRLLVLLAAALPLLVVIGLQALRAQANANWAAPAYLSLLVVLAAVIVERRWWWWLKVGIATNAALAVILITLAFAHTTPSPFTSRLDPYRKLRGDEQLAAGVVDALRRDPNTRLIMDNRMLLAQAIHAGDLQLDRVIKWNPDGNADDHFEMVTGIAAGQEDRFLLATRRYHPDDILERFDRTQRLQPILVPTHPDRTTRLFLFALEGFQGYSRAAP